MAYQVATLNYKRPALSIWRVSLHLRKQVNIMKRHIRIPYPILFILVTIFCASLVLNLIHFLPQEPSLPEIVGSYCTGNPSDPVLDKKYLVFADDMTYCLYTQLTPLEYGTYQEIQQFIYVLTSEEGTSSQILLTEDGVYLFTDGAPIQQYTKFSSVLVYFSGSWTQPSPDASFSAPTTS